MKFQKEEHFELTVIEPVGISLLMNIIKSPFQASF